jgi:hypothetical protein
MGGKQSGLMEICCKFTRVVYILLLSRSMEQLLTYKIDKTLPHPVEFSLRFFKSDRLLPNETDIIRLTLSSFCHKFTKNYISVREDIQYEFRYP